MLRLIIVSCILTLSLGSSNPEVRKPLRTLSPIFPSGRIVGGTDADIKEIPYQLSLEYFGFQFCGASIITENYVLSAAHCVDTFMPKELTIRYGSSEHENGGTIVQVKSILIHNRYIADFIDYDVSLLELETLIILSENAQPIKPADEEPSAGTLVQISGWGTLDEDGETPDVLQSLTVPIFDREECATIYAALNPLTSRMICAGEPGRDSCQGDSGGAVTFNGTVVGIVSWGLGCGREGYPGVYTNVADNDIRDFIRKTTGI